MIEKERELIYDESGFPIGYIVETEPEAACLSRTKHN